MSFDWKYDLLDIDWFELSDLYKAAPLGNKQAQALETVFSNSRYKCFILDEGRLIGVGRALADGVDCSYICDVAVLPDYQGMGLGKKIVEQLVTLSTGHNKIILYTIPGSESFYEKIGFKHMTTAMAIFGDHSKALALGLISNE